MRCLKITAFFAMPALAVLVSAADISRAAVSLGGAPVQKGAIYMQLADNGAAVSGRGILNGYKGYRHPRPGYRRHSDSWWYPREAFEPKQPVSAEEKTVKSKKTLPARHTSWCAGKYLSYRRQDNSFQPYYGARRPCISPYFKKD